MISSTCLFAGTLTILAMAVSAMPPVLYEGDVCNLGNDKKGLCKPLSKCQPAYERLQKMREKPRHCSFYGFEEVVCCDDVTSQSLRKSELACREYGNEIPLRVNPFITGGEDAEPGEYPHMAALRYVEEQGDDTEWKCAGSLISDRHVLTAAHCIVDTNLRKAPVEVLLGAVDLNNQGYMAEKYRIEDIIRHPNYSISKAYNDIAIIVLKRRVKFSENVQPACLYTKKDAPETGLRITGWGATSNSRSSKSSTLKKGIISLVANNNCNKSYRSTKKLDKGIQDTMVCAGDPNGIVDTCNGDSGGPLQVLTPDSNIFSIVGVTSVGPAVCGGQEPAIYTRVSSYIDWIEKEVWG